LETFRGYLAADEVYDGPFCVLSIVDHHTFQRLAYRVLEHDPTPEDIRAFFGKFKAPSDARGLKVLGITTDGSALYPVVIKDLFPEARHPVCEFHVLPETTKAVCTRGPRSARNSRPNSLLCREVAPRRPGKLKPAKSNGFSSGWAICSTLGTGL
jgi:hypothetical protein